eukprot:gnl/MRDRNA2_/MRDRNA2_67502_c0_seq1.p1 gnl/MRDRNA2_/MRDRNA2_67502_c0~~gnl/MRDRNA2_/MRDRNA2_67502_c0_seq1.p1  ORF type:complete len:137 (-),score=11.22 gnl/MRDRNA2_/MRDRNA2_67502_c0_seq1:553-963(-)
MACTSPANWSLTLLHSLILSLTTAHYRAVICLHCESHVSTTEASERHAIAIDVLQISGQHLLDLAEICSIARLPHADPAAVSLRCANSLSVVNGLHIFWDFILDFADNSFTAPSAIELHPESHLPFVLLIQIPIGR